MILANDFWSESQDVSPTDERVNALQRNKPNNTSFVDDRLTEAKLDPNTDGSFSVEMIQAHRLDFDELDKNLATTTSSLGSMSRLAICSKRNMTNMEVREKRERANHSCVTN